MPIPVFEPYSPGLNEDINSRIKNLSNAYIETTNYLSWILQHLDGTNVKYHAWGDSIVDDVDATHKIKLKFSIPEKIIRVQKLTLNFSLEAFRAYETGAASGGSSSPTTSSGGGSTQTSSNGGGATTSSGGGQTTSSGGGSTPTSSSGNTGHTHGLTTNQFQGDNTGETDGHTHTYTYQYQYETEVSGASHTHTVSISDHSHTVSDHTHTVGNHTHDVTVPNHTHTVTISSHTHPITYGIYESTSATGCKVYVDGTLRLDNGGAGYTTDQADLDLTEWVLTSGWHTIEISSTQLGRINAAYFIQIYAGQSGL